MADAGVRMSGHEKFDPSFPAIYCAVFAAYGVMMRPPERLFYAARGIVLMGDDEIRQLMVDFAAFYAAEPADTQHDNFPVRKDDDSPAAAIRLQASLFTAWADRVRFFAPKTK